MVGDKADYRPAEVLTPEDVERLRAAKPEVMRLLRHKAERLRVAPPPVRDLVAEYCAVLGRLWLLNAPDSSRSPHARRADVAEARRLLAEQARLVDELGPEFAAAVSRQHARAWSQTMGRCPWCGLAGVFHDPATGGERAL